MTVLPGIFINAGTFASLPDYTVIFMLC